MSFAYIKLIGFSAVFAMVGQTFAAEFDTVNSIRSGVWEANLFKNKDGNRMFCAAETRDGSTIFRINRYRDSGDTFFELFNPDWTMKKGNVRFSIDFDIKGENYKADIAGKSWGDSYTHDFTDVKNYELILALLASSKSFNVKNSNGTQIASFSSSGSLEALRAYNACVNQNQ